MSTPARWGGKNHRAVRGGPRTQPKAHRGQDRPLEGNVSWPTLADGTQVVQEALPLDVTYRTLAGEPIPAALMSVHWAGEHWAGWLRVQDSDPLVAVRLIRLEAVTDGST